AGDLAPPAGLGRALRLDDAQGRYVEFVKRTIPRRISLDGIKVVIDCANGAAYKVAPAVLWELGAEVVPLAVSPDGLNINDGCGSTHPEAMCSAVVAHGAHMGIALDGDADRVLIADETGALIDGDQIMAVIAKHWADDGWLQGGAVVSTVMSNLGLERYLDGIGLKLLRTQVGDRYVVERMRELGCNLGGEQSGHIVMADHGTTGDGLAAALQLLSIISASGKPVSEACRPFEPLPQILRNVAVNGAAPLEDSGIQKAIKAGEARMGSDGRVLIRASGTEPLVRVMAEGNDKALIDSVVGDIVAEIERFVAA
ncbi:MAG: phosphoglucosamine mutase, partial [Rhodospirillaceae bacterium]|nr:phosphoglucosamine mutase [Rhodospirillaceae bacterium]